MDMKVGDGLQPLQKQLSSTITKLYQVASLPKIAYALRLGTLFICLYITYSVFSDGSGEGIDYKQSITTAVRGKKNVFIQSVLDNEIDGPFDNSTLVDLCAKTKWVPGLIFKCDPPEGAVGNVRNVFLNCLRYSIEAGASGFVVPEMFALTHGLKYSLVPFGHFFDANHFTTSLSEACPQIQVYNHVNDLYDMPSTAKAVPMVPTSFNHTTLIGKHILAHPGNWSISFAQFLNYTHPVAPTAAKPVLVSVAPSLFEFPLSYDDRHFVPSFGRLLRFRQDTRRIAAAVLYAMSQKHKLGLSFSKDQRMMPSKFYGAHLRTGNDAKAARWTPFDIQSANYLRDATRHSLPVMYVAAGSPDDIARLMATNSSVDIETKESLLGAPPVMGVQTGGAKGFEREWGEMQTLRWDQQLLIDYEVLLRSSLFGGTWESTFSWNIAMRRHVVIVNGAWKATAKREEKQAVPAEKDEIGEVEDVDEEAEIDEEELEEFEDENGLIADEKGLVAGETIKQPGQVSMFGKKAFTDGLSTVFGTRGVGKRIVASMWP